MITKQAERHIDTEQNAYAENVMARPLFGDIFWLDIARGGRQIGCRARASSADCGDRLLDSLSEECRSELLRYLKSYETKPAVLESECGPVMILPNLMPAASLAVAVFPRMDFGTFWKLAARDPLGILSIGGCLKKNGTGRLPARTAGEQAIYADFMECVRRCYQDYRAAGSRKPMQIDGVLTERILLLGSLLGCPVRVERQENILDYGDFDLSHFLAFATVILSLAWKSTAKREAVFSFKQQSCGCMVSVVLPGWKPSGSIPPELPWLDSFAGRKQMIFDYTTMPDSLLLRFSPTVKDWAYLGLKQESRFCWGGVSPCHNRQKTGCFFWNNFLRFLG